jgi:endogenous inhibitor of DNA gyrase (YacG/DUF329 family)
VAEVLVPEYTSPVRPSTCPLCRREAAHEGNPHRPFCSERCRLLDLSAWATERYRIAGDPVTLPDAAEDDPV